MKRLIFCLLFNQGQYIQSRNFRQQRVGDLNWVLSNYNLLNVSCGIDEIVLLNVGEEKQTGLFAEHIKKISNSCFVPLAAGGGIDSLKTARLFMNAGADKLILNTAFHTDPELPKQLAEKYGSQCVIASVDYLQDKTGYSLFSSTVELDGSTTIQAHLENIVEAGAGEVLCQSVDKDGTGMGLEIAFADQYLQSLDIPCIMLGGVGKAPHILEGLQKESIDAVCTANLLNFIGDSFEKARAQIIADGIPIPEFSTKELTALKDRLSKFDQ